VTADLIDRAQAGDGDAFGELTEPYRRELQVHCYRMLGSFQDAEDALQDTLLAAWQGIGGYEGREITWLEPYPDSLLAGAFDAPLGPEARYEQTEAISLTFVTALQALPARQLAVLILRDVLGYHADEVADMLDSTVDSVNSALKRGRASLQRLMPATGERRPPAPDSPAERALVERFVASYESGDVEALVALLTDDVLISMPPVPLQFQGRDVVGRFFAGIFGAGRHAYDLVPAMRANSQLAFGAFLRTPSGIRQGTSLLVLTLTGDRICAITGFDKEVFSLFGLPQSLPS
jgi:RNA polymerase sigma-70 factor (TIGR02960 family)